MIKEIINKMFNKFFTYQQSLKINQSLTVFKKATVVFVFAISFMFVAAAETSHI
jgi:hypothetical protein